MGPATGRITGVGGVFVKSKDPKALAAWYRDVLGLHLEDWGGALLGSERAEAPPHAVWAPFKADTDYMQPSSRDFMLDFAVDDLDLFLARIEAKGVMVLAKSDNDPNGKFAWIMDPDGTKIEHWQPK